jgi:hypothetical protein
MILRAGELFLNGSMSAKHLQRDEQKVWHALEQNVGGIIDFFDIIVTRDTIPLINYFHTYDRGTTPASIEDMLSFMVQRVEIDYMPYEEIKKGALLNLASIDLAALDPIMSVLSELDAFRYEWNPLLDVPGDPELDDVRPKFANLSGPSLLTARFLLGGFIFGGFAQASRTTHYIQPKRSRFFLGLTAAPEKIRTLAHDEEAGIFETAQASLKGGKATVWRTEPIPPVLPYLLAQVSKTATPRDLLDRALEFRLSSEGRKYRELVSRIRADGVDARRAVDLVGTERKEALELLQPYSHIETKESGSLEIVLPGELFGAAGLDTSVKIPVGIPRWLKVWWNDKVPLGGLRKTLRRMWMRADGYKDFAGKLRTVWSNS